jgi:L-fucose mutarotase
VVSRVGIVVPDPKDPQVLKNLNPVITGDLLRVLDAMQPGELLALVSAGYPEHHANTPAIEMTEISVESAVEAIFSVLSVDASHESPLLCWLADASDYAAVDIAFAVKGLASDAELTRVGMTTLGATDFDQEMNAAVATIRFPEQSTPWAFLIRAGGR